MHTTNNNFNERCTKIYGNKNLCSVALALLLIAATVIPLMGQSMPVAQAQISSIPSNMLQYEWTQLSSDAAHSFSSSGPGPSAANIKWRAQITGASGYLVAFNGLVFAEGSGKTYALDGGTGDVIWTASGVTGGKIKIDSNYMIIGSKCVKIADGTVVWTGPAGFSAPGSMYQGLQYIPELKMFADSNCGWSLPDPTNPPTLAWNRTADLRYGVERCLAYGDGKLFVGSPESFLTAVDAATGKTLWSTPTTGAFWYGGCYIDGKFIQGGLDNNMHAWDADTGNLLWTYNPGTWYGMWASAACSSYGMIFQHNQDTYLYAINASTGELVWRQKGPGIGYSNTLSVAGGKVYCQMGDNQYRNPVTGEYAVSEYDCFDAYTGQLLWTLPLENGAPFDMQCNAYGNLYLIPTESPQVPGQWRYSMSGVGSLNEVWCISSDSVDWSMYGADPQHTSLGAGPTDLQLKWATKFDAPIQSTPTIVNGVAYFGTHLGTIYAVNAGTGNEIWKFQTNQMVKSTVAVVNGKLYTGADDGNVYCLDAATGKQLWETDAGGVKVNPLQALVSGGQSLQFVGADNPRSSPVVVDGKVYVGALDGNFYCFDANSGSVNWKLQTGGPIQATATIVNGEIYIPSSTPKPDGTVYKLDLNGNVIWQKHFPYVLNQSTGFGFYLLAPVTVAPDLGMVFVRNAFRLNYALNATTGETIWTYDGKYNPGTPNQLGGVTQFMPMLYNYGLLYFNDFYGITCLDARNGTEVWYTYLSRENLAQYLSYSYNRIYTVTEAGALYVLDSLTGAKLSYYEFSPSRSQLHCAPTPYNGLLYIGANDWTFYCFGDARIMSAQAQTSSPAASPSTQTPEPLPAALETSVIFSTQTLAPPMPSPSVAASNETSVLSYVIAAVVVVVVVVALAGFLLKRRK
jgi:outer membrane protein assembly factor BamB